MNYRKKLAYGIVCLVALAACAPPVGPGADNQGQTPAATETATTTTDGEDNLAGTQWSLVSMGVPGAESPAVAGTMITLAFETAGQAGGSGGCNWYGGEYRVEGNTLSFGEIARTLMGCEAKR